MTTKVATCYITGKPTTIRDTYYFGSEGHVVLQLTQSAFAYFVIRAGNDVMHKEILADIKQAVDDVIAFKVKHDADPSIGNTDSYIDMAVDRSIRADKLDTRMANLLTQKCENGVRILRKIKKDFEDTGKLS